ncbi:hypothetical protein BVY04_01775 [bacterium M21]|nr:hypothetical protein BVY04_01775 [bacterium M21]
MNKGSVMMKYIVAILCALLALPLVGAEQSPETRGQIEADWKQQEKISWKRSADSPAALDALLKRAALMLSDMTKLGAPDTFARTKNVLEEVGDMRTLLIAKKAPAGKAWLDEYLKARWVLRDLAFSNSLLDFDEIMFVKRITPTFNHQCAHRVGEAQIPPANLCILKGLSPDAEVKELLTGDDAKGGIGRPDLSFDGKRIVFPLAKLRAKPTKYKAMPRCGEGLGMTITYDIYEVGTDGTNLRQLTNERMSEDTEPCYLPDGRIAFTSSRADRYVQCGDWALVFGIYTMAPDGSDLRKVTEPQDGEFYPVMLEDGRIMYTRWDYVMKPYNTQQQLWAVNPDGRRAELVYGDYYKFSNGPIALFEARQIPGTSKVICTGAAHHNNCAGPIMIVDLKQNRGGPEGMQKITPEIHYPEIKGENGGPRYSKTGWFSAPYPLGENHFLVCNSFDKVTTNANYGIYLMDVHGNRELIYRTNDKFSCYAPIPVRARKKPRVIPDMVTGVPDDKLATLIVNDIYQGLLQEGVKRGEVKYLRIIEVLPKTQHTNPRRMDLGVNSGWDTRVVLGTVPIEDDGSVHFQIPPHKLIAFEALDKDYLEIKRMRNYLNMKPGESNSCVGCHEPYGMTPSSTAHVPKAAKRGPSPVIPPPWGVQGMSFRRVVQPVLDKHCIKCHDGSEAKLKAFNLKDNEMVAAPIGYDKDEGPQHAVSTSFLNLLKHVEYVRVGGYDGLTVPSDANSTGSRASNVMKVLKKGHSKVKLSTDEWRAIAAWIDCNAPFYGDFENIETAKNGDALSRKDRRRLTARTKQLDGFDKSAQLRAYLDCGLVTKSDGKKPVKIALVKGSNYFFKEAIGIAGTCWSEADIAHEAEQVVFNVSGLAKAGRYKVGISWWDYDNGGRTQSVHCGTKQVIVPIKLPAYKGGKELPNRVFATIPSDQIKNGKVTISIKRESGTNALISEIWIEEELGCPPQSSLDTRPRSFAVADLRLHKGMIFKNSKLEREFPMKNATDISVAKDGRVLVGGANTILLVDGAGKTLFEPRGRQLFSARFLSNGNILLNNNPKQAVVEFSPGGEQVAMTSTKIEGSKVKPQYHALHVRVAPDGNFWVAHRHNNMARKYDRSGKVLRTLEMPCSVTSVEELANGHVLVSGGVPGPAQVTEFNATGKAIWTLSASDVPEANLMTPCGIQRLTNGNTLITNWTGHGFKGKYLPIIEVSVDKHIVWAFTDTAAVPEPVAIQMLD